MFGSLSDPTRHIDLDGSGMVRGAVADGPVTAVSDVFAMRMHFPALGDYEMENHVVAFQRDRRIGWRPVAGRGHPEQGEPARDHRWSYELLPDGPDATIVTETYDCSRAPEAARSSVAGGRLWMDAMLATLDRLDRSAPADEFGVAVPSYWQRTPICQENPMAAITASMFMALDGVVDPAVGNWHFPYFNEEMGDAVAGTHDTDVMLFGRVTYDSFAGAWPGREAAGEEDAVFAKRLGDMRKIVASRSPLQFTWRNSEQLDGDLIETVTALKNDATIRRIVLSGSVSVVRQLLDAGLLDELHLFLHPATAGSGLRLFEDGGPGRYMKLISCRSFTTGVVYLAYAPDASPPTGGYEDAKEQLPQE